MILSKLGDRLRGATRPSRSNAEPMKFTQLLACAARYRWNRVRSRVGALAVILATISPFGAVVAGATYPAVDAGYRLARQGKLYWLDNDRVLFYGGSAKQDSKRVGTGSTIPAAGGTYIWNVAAGSLEHVSEWEITCYHPEYSTWSLVRPAKNEYRFKAGKFGQETELPPEKLTVQQRMQRVRSDFTCKSYRLSDLVPPPPLGRRVIVLREGDGYLDVGPHSTAERIKEIRAHGSKPILLFRPNALSAIALPITAEQGPGNPKYSAYLDAYVALPRAKGSDPGHIRSWPRGLPFIVYSFKNTGEASEATIPYGEWGGIANVQPTRAGWMFAGSGTTPPKSGLFLSQHPSVRKLDAGQVHALAVSRDGCRAAVGIQNRHLEMGTPINLKVLELCGEGGKP